MGSVEMLDRTNWRTGQAFTLDFGNHTVGQVGFDLSADGTMDSPIRLQLIFGEVAAEVCEPFDPYSGTLSRAWLQDEIINVDAVPTRVILPRRYAFRYLKVVATHVPERGNLRFGGFVCTTVSSARREQAGELPASVPDDVRAMDTISLRTLTNCMQTVFEDGPKRDRRLWIGDLRLQALVNLVSFRNFGLVKRCLYLFAGLAREDGIVSACVCEFPQPVRGDNFILDYEALFIPTLLEYARESGDWETARELWPVAWHQAEHLLCYVDDRWSFNDPGNYWLFIDWRENLDKQAAFQGVMIYALRAVLTLASRLGEDSQAARLRSQIAAMAQAACEHFFSREMGVFVSGPNRQRSWASQAWMILADVVEAEQGREILGRMMADAEAVRPASPYLYHYVLEAMFKVGMESEAVALIRRYWGDMMQKGATTFWEVHDPEDPLLSPYGSYLINSYCHAWSCTPAYFIRRYPHAFGTA